MTDIPILHTRRLILRGQRPSDTEPLTRALAEDGFARFITREKRGLDRVEAWRLVALVAGSWAACGYGQWMVEERATASPVGRVGPWAPAGWPDFEIGWTVFPWAQGRGYAREAAAAAMVWVRETLGRGHVIHLIDPANAASERVAAALGGRRTGLWTVPTGEEIPVWTTRWDDFVETDAYRNHARAPSG